MQIEILDNNRGDEYDDFLKEDPNTLFFASNRYRLLLREFLKAEDRYLLLVDYDNKIKAALPLFIKQNQQFGTVINSLPFYGSNGAAICPGGNELFKNELLTAYKDLLKETDCAAATLISSPFEQNNEIYENILEPTFIDKRIGQLTPLPKACDDLDDRLMSMYHQKTRNLVRKAAKYGFNVSADPTSEAIDFLIEVHRENMLEIGGITKPDSFFRLIPEFFEYGAHYRIYCAYKGKEPCAAMLVFYFNRTVEYFTPVVKKEYRSEQPLSLLIYRAMAEAVNEGYSWWNWGGTWISQEGVYHFKKRWGTEDKPYFYFVNLRSNSLLSVSSSELLKEYPYFYVVPFDRIQIGI